MRLSIRSLLLLIAYFALVSAALSDFRDSPNSPQAEYLAMGASFLSAIVMYLAGTSIGYDQSGNSRGALIGLVVAFILSLLFGVFMMRRMI